MTHDASETRSRRGALRTNIAKCSIRVRVRVLVRINIRVMVRDWCYGASETRSRRGALRTKSSIRVRVTVRVMVRSGELRTNIAKCSVEVRVMVGLGLE